MKLADYRSKRDPRTTPEPFGKDPAPRDTPTMEGAFVVHLHDAQRRHYDLRLEAGGVLASFAVPRGPSFDPTERRLAVQTEDHPIDYLDFEAVIPKGSYGGGAMILWDRGRVRYLERGVEEGLAKGKVDFDLDGLKLKGRFSLRRMKDGPRDWLLLKRADAYASTPTTPGGPAARDPVRDLPRSVLSGLTVEELGASSRIGGDLEAKAAALGAPTVEETRFDARRTVPMTCAMEGAPERDPGWLYELKLDGVRALAIKEGPKVTLLGRKLREITASYPEVARAVEALPPENVVLDGEIVAFDASGRPSFSRLSHRIHIDKAHEVRAMMRETPVTFVAFDVLVLGARDLTSLPLAKRRPLLDALLPAPGVVRRLEIVAGDSTKLMAFCDAHDLEGLVAKRADSPYRAGPRRSGDWVKMKRKRDEDFVVVGYTRGTGSRDRLGALDLASFEGGRLTGRGKVGSGLDDRAIEKLLALFAALPPPSSGDGSEGLGLSIAAQGRTRVAPRVVVRVRFDGWSEDGNLLHAVFLGVRDDVDPKDCTAAPPEDLVTDAYEPASLEASAPRTPIASFPSSASSASDASAEPAPSPSPSPSQTAPVTSTTPAKEPELGVSNPTKVLWPGEGITKRELVDYYRAIAPAMLRYLKGRPVMLVRYPDGILGKSFYQWNVPRGTPSWVETFRMKIDSGSDSTEVFLVSDERALTHVANLAAIPIHILASRARTLDACDFLTMDFDVKGASLREGITLALALRELCDGIGLESFPKTSGQSGLHVFAPLGPGVTYATARALADLLGGLLCARFPAIATMERIVAKRGPRVYVDTGQTGPTRTIVAPWSVRAKPGATVSMPLLWSEVTEALDPTAFTIRTALDRLRVTGDPMAPLLDVKPDVPRAVARLGQMVGR